MTAIINMDYDFCGSQNFRSSCRNALQCRIFVT